MHFSDTTFTQHQWEDDLIDLFYAGNIFFVWFSILIWGFFRVLYTWYFSFFLLIWCKQLMKAFYPYSLTIDHNQPESTRYSLERSHKLLEKMNSLSSISSVDTDRFRATIENNFAKNNMEKYHKESLQNVVTQRNSTSNLQISVSIFIIIFLSSRTD